MVVAPLVPYSNNIPMSRAARPKPVYLWTVQDVQKWLKRHCSDYHPLYSDKFLFHEVTGRTLMKMTDGKLLRLGIEQADHRQEIWREIMKLGLKSGLLECRDLLRTESDLV